MSKIVQGKNVILAIHDGTAYLPIGCLITNSITETQDITEGSPNKCDDTISKSQGSYSYEVSGEAVMLDLGDDDYSTKAHYDKVRDLWKASRVSGDAINWSMTGGNTDMFGTGFITELPAEYPTDGDATFSVSISGIGEIEATDPLA